MVLLWFIMVCCGLFSRLMKQVMLKLKWKRNRELFENQETRKKMFGSHCKFGSHCMFGSHCVLFDITSQHQRD